MGRICSELVFGYNRHPAWDAAGCGGCFSQDDIEDFEGWMPGISACVVDVVQIDGRHPSKAGPCVSCHGLEPYQRLRDKLDGCLTGSQLAKDRAAQAIARVMIPEALDYPR